MEIYSIENYILLNQSNNQINKNLTNFNDSTDKTHSVSIKNNISESKEPKPQEKRKTEELKKIDSKVRAHESAHLAAGAGIVRGGASFTYTMGPDGKMYATGGEVSIDISEIPDNPEATIRKMQQVKRAALAPDDPSPQDRSIAAKAASIESKARAEAQSEKPKSYNINNTKIYIQNQNPSDNPIGNLIDVVIY